MNHDPLLASLCAAVDDLLPELTELRRDLHRHPELSRAETRTTAVVAQRLADVGVAVRLLPGTGLTADLGAEQPAYRVVLRADLDALPLHESTGLPWTSTVEGVCHACGHDMHTAVVLAAGLALHALEEELVRRGIAVRLVFQPAEEVIPGGALELIEQGVLDGVDRVLGVHCDTTLDVGQVGLAQGPITAASDSVTVELSGRGGHTSRPHLTEDLTYALAKVVTDVPAALGRRVDPRAGAALVWGTIHAGVAQNVIPASGSVGGTLRVLDPDVWEAVGALLDEIVPAVVSPYAVSAKVEHVRGVPPVVNDEAAIEALRWAATEVLGAQAPQPTRQSLGGEDYAWYLQRVPGALARLGTRTPGGRTYDLHQGDLVVDEAALAGGARLLAAAALRSDQRSHIAAR